MPTKKRPARPAAARSEPLVTEDSRVAYEHFVPAGMPDALL